MLRNKQLPIALGLFLTLLCRVAAAGVEDWPTVECENVEGRVLAFDPRDPAIAYVGTLSDGLFRSLDGGVTWKRVTTTDGILSIAFSAAQPGAVYAGTTRGVLTSRDGGSTWALSTRGLQPEPCAGPFPCVSTREIWAIAVDPTLPSRLLAGGNNGIFESQDGGRRWLPVDDPLSQRMIFALRFDPEAPSTVYAGTDAGFWRSENGGRTWHASSEGLDNIAVRAIASEPAPSSLIYAATDRGVYGSENGGETWFSLNEGIAVDSRIPLVTHTVPVADIVISSEAPGTVYAATFYAGVFRSDDYGRNWHATGTPTGQFFIPVFSMALDPERPGRVLAGTGRDGVFRSLDGGASWQPSFDLGAVPTIDAVDPSPVVVGTTAWGDSTGATGFFLMVYGTGFREDSVVWWNGSLRPTQRLSCTRLMVTIPSTDAARPGSAMIQVVSSGIGFPASKPFGIAIVSPEVRLGPGPQRDRSTRVVVRD
jgi:photosystem II stability/assembly factor-like uncharacterized protein